MKLAIERKSIIKQPILGLM